MKNNNSNLKFEIFYNPYQLNNDDDTATMFNRYCNDTERVTEIDGIVFFKAFQIIKTNIKGHRLIVGLSTEINLRIGDKIYDDCNNEYEVKGIEMIRFAANIPYWYLKMTFTVLSGNPENVGKYFAKQKI